MGRALSRGDECSETAKHTYEQDEDDGLAHVDHHWPEKVFGSPSFRLLG